MNKKPIVVVCIADSKNIEYATSMINSLRKFHPLWPIVLVTDASSYPKLPRNIALKDLTTYTKTDPMFFYRATPILGEELIEEYECVLKIDADSIVTGSLSYILETKDYDVATVVNWNRVDPQVFGPVAGWGIFPPEYFNCGLVAMRSAKFVHQWKVLCFTDQFNRLQYKEQDILNAVCYFGNFNVRCLDHGDKVAKMSAWWGLISKGEYPRAILKDNKIIVPKGLGDQPFPAQDTEIKVIHAAEGGKPNKMNYHTWFAERIADRLDYLTRGKDGR